MALAWHPKIWQDWRLPEDEKKEVEPIFIEELKKCASLVYDMEVLKHFVEECAGSIQLGDIGAFGSTRTFCMKNQYDSKIFLNFHV